MVKGKCLNLSTDMATNRYELIRERFRPGKVRVLLVGESRPASGEFFFCEDSRLVKYTDEAFAERYGPYTDMSSFLAQFKSLGCYLARVGRNNRRALRRMSAAAILVYASAHELHAFQSAKAWPGQACCGLADLNFSRTGEARRLSAGFGWRVRRVATLLGLTCGAMPFGYCALRGLLTAAINTSAVDMARDHQVFDFGGYLPGVPSMDICFSRSAAVCRSWPIPVSKVTSFILFLIAAVSSQASVICL
jgi:hypothetical protein